MVGFFNFVSVYQVSVSDATGSLKTTFIILCILFTVCLDPIWMYNLLLNYGKLIIDLLEKVNIYNLLIYISDKLLLGMIISISYSTYGDSIGFIFNLVYSLEFDLFLKFEN